MSPELARANDRRERSRRSCGLTCASRSVRLWAPKESFDRGGPVKRFRRTLSMSVILPSKGGDVIDPDDRRDLDLLWSIKKLPARGTTS